jgi:hypothetical protein
MFLNSAVKLLDIANEKYRHNIAVTDETGSITYAEYHEKSMKLAGGLLPYLDAKILLKYVWDIPQRR